MSVHHDVFKSAIANSFDKSDIKFSKVSDLTKEEFERLLAIRSLQDSQFNQSEMDEFKKILNSPTGELIFRMGYFASKQS